MSGEEGIRTPDLRSAEPTLYPLSYDPVRLGPASRTRCLLLPKQAGQPSPPSQMAQSAASVAAVRVPNVVRCGVLKHRVPGQRRDDAHGRKDSNPQLTALETVALARLSYVRVMAYFQQKPPAPNSRTGGCRFARAYPRRRTRVCSPSSARCLEKGMVTSPHGMNHCGCPEVDHNTCCSFVERSLTTVRRRWRRWQPGNRDGPASIDSLQCVMFHCGHGGATGSSCATRCTALSSETRRRQLCRNHRSDDEPAATDWTVKHNRVKNNTKTCPADVGRPFSASASRWRAPTERTIEGRWVRQAGPHLRIRHVTSEHRHHECVPNLRVCSVL